MLRVTDPLWLHLAALAGVRPPHCWHAFCFMRQQKERFNAEAYAAFAGLEIRHVTRMLDVFASELVFNTSPEKSQAARGTRLPSDFKVSGEWIGWAITQRRWTQDVAETVAAEFCDYWPAQPGVKGVKTDWFATWRNWVRRSHSPDGAPQKDTADPEAFRELCRRGIAVESARGNRIAVEQWRRKLEGA